MLPLASGWSSTQGACHSPAPPGPEHGPCWWLVEPARRSPFSQIPGFCKPTLSNGLAMAGVFTQWKLPYAANQGYFSEACLLLYHWFPPSQPSLQGNMVAAALTSGSSFSLSNSRLRPGHGPCSSPLRVSPPGLSAFSFCRILLGKHSSLQMAGGGGLFSLVLQAPLGLRTEVPSLAPSAPSQEPPWPPCP